MNCTLHVKIAIEFSFFAFCDNLFLYKKCASKIYHKHFISSGERRLLAGET